MNAILNQQSIALFGSRARGDSDAFSDSDLLVISDHFIDREQNLFAQRGFSVSSFTWKQFEAMAADGSLFVQHVKQESIILSDADGRLQSVLGGFSPECDQRSRLSDNCAFFEVTCGTPDHIRTIGWAFDVLAVAVRNHAVLLAAQEESYIFSFASLIDWLARKYGLSSNELALLGALRPLKHEYRTTSQVRSADWQQLLATQTVIERIFSVGCTGAPKSLVEFSRERIDVVPSSRHWYLTLRSYEGAMRALYAMLAPESMKSFDEMEVLVRKPSPYAIADIGGFANIQAALLGALSKLVPTL